MPSQFATLNDVLVSYDTDTALLAFDPEKTGDINDPGVIARADFQFQRASAKILSIIGGAYTIPDTPPDDTATFLKSCTVDIGIYLSVPRTGPYLEEWAKRAQMCMDLLEKIASGDAQLPGIDEDPNKAAPQVEAPERVYYRPETGEVGLGGLV